MNTLSGREVEICDLGPLTPREAEALLWVAEGKTAWEAGTILGISEATANAHITKAADKLRASNRPHLVTRAFVLGILRATNSMLLLAVLTHFTCEEDGSAFWKRMPRRKREETELSVHDIRPRLI
jgi:DNA-binding CsgD family transcriptional regulator